MNIIKSYHKNGEIKKEEYMVNGVLHREDGPAFIINYRHGGPCMERYFKNNELCIRENGEPPCIYYNNINGNIESESYYHKNLLHRENGPAIIEYNIDGKKIEERYYLYGDLHNENGPAIVRYDSDGRIVQSHYFINGNKVKLTSDVSIKKIKLTRTINGLLKLRLSIILSSCDNKDDLLQLVDSKILMIKLL